MQQHSLSHSKDMTINEEKITKHKISFDYEAIFNLYKKEFPYYCEKMLLKPRNDIFDIFFEKMNSIINYYFENENKDKLKDIINKCENDFLIKEYIPMYNSLCLAFSIIYDKKNEKNKIKNSLLTPNLNYINNFIPHCLSNKPNNEYAIHACGEKLIEINKDILLNNNSRNVVKRNNNISYVLCPKCKKCYNKNLILMYCNHCEKSYFSKLIKNKNNIKLYPVTWEKYHCLNSENINDINNYKYEEQIPCINCSSKFFLKNNLLFCKNCQFQIEPKNLVWTCFKCAKEFRSNIKIYNSLNRKIIKHIIRDAFIQQKEIKPIDLPCNCLNTYKNENINFFHKKEGKCNGILYYNSFNGKDYIVCSLCKYICYLNDFNWFCPFCLRYFISNKLKLNVNKNNNSNIYVRKNIVENWPKTKRYFSPNPSKNIINKTNTSFELRKIYLSSSKQRLFSHQKNIYENKNLFNNKNSINNIKYSQFSTVYSSYKKEGFNKNNRYKKKVKSCNNSLDKIRKNEFDKIEEGIKSKPYKSNLKINISSKKIERKSFMPNKCQGFISRFNLFQKNLNNNDNDLNAKLNENNMRKKKIILSKPKINMSSSLIVSSDNNNANKENNNYLNNEKINTLIGDKIVYSNREKRNKCQPSKNEKTKINNSINIGTINNLPKKSNNKVCRKTHYHFSQKKINEKNKKINNKNLKRNEQNISFENGFISHRKNK